MKIIEATAFHLKAPLEIPYKTTFGSMTHRQAVFVRLTDENHVEGIGETYINFPVWSPFGRLAAYREAFFPDVTGAEIEDIPGFMQTLWKRHFRASMQGNCLGATIQSLSAISTALWDIRAKYEGKSLRSLFSGNPANRVKIYGSGINPPFPVDALREGLDMGMDVFKLKLGFGNDTDKENIRQLKSLLGSSVRIAVDVNRSWSYEQTVDWMGFLCDNDIAWLEEPLDMIDQHRYPELVGLATIPVSAGENFLIPPGTDFKRENEWGLSFNDSGLAPDIIQPAVVKNCCFSDAVRLMHHVEGMGKRIYPHFLGSAPGMAASANLAALSKEPHLEWDINPNPLRSSCFDGVFHGVGGYLELSDEPGIGWSIREEVYDKWVVDRVEVKV
ncbi:mandelate racemase/muconate lactonizing enzyme family protein [Candidatus Latescibacterota bacterium]